MQDLNPAPRRHQQGRLPDEVLRNALDKHYKYKTFVSIGNSRPICCVSGIGMARLQFGDGEYAQSVYEMQRLPMSSSLQTERLTEIEEPVQVTRTLLRTPTINPIAGSPSRNSTAAVSALGLNATLGGFSAASPLTPSAPTTSSYQAMLASRPGVSFRETGSTLAAILAATEDNSGEVEMAERWTPVESRPSEAGSSSRDLGTSWPRRVSRRSLGRSATASRALSITGESEAGDSVGNSGNGDGRGFLQRRPSLPPPELAAVMSLQQQLQQCLQPQSGGLSPSSTRRESTGADRPGLRPSLPPQTQQPLQPQRPHAPPPPLQTSPRLLNQPQQQSSAGSPSSTQSSESGTFPPSTIRGYHAEGVAAAATAPCGLPTPLQPYQPAQQSPRLPGGLVHEDFPRRKRGSIMSVYGNPSHPSPYQLLETPRPSDRLGEGGVTPAGVHRPVMSARRRNVGRSSGGGGGRSQSEAGEPDVREASTSGCGSCIVTPHATDNGLLLLGGELFNQRLMSSADIAVINEAARRYNFPQAVERQQQPGADGNTAVAASPPGVTRTLTVRRHPPEPRFSPTDRRQAATSPNKPAAAPGIVATERTDDLLRVLRSPEPPASMSIGSCVGLSGRSSGKCDITGDAGGEGPMAPRPPLAAAGKIGGSGSFRRSSSIRTRISSQSTGEVPASVVAVTAAAGCESDATGSSPPLRPSISHSMSPQDAYEPQSLHGLSSCSSVFEARVGSGSRGDGDAARPSEEGAAAATNGPEDLNGLGGGGGGSTSAVTSPTAAGFSKSSGPLRGWSSRKELLKSPFASSKTHTLTTDARQGGDSEGESADESQQALRRSPSMARATSRLSISGSAAAALAAAVGRISVNIRVADETDGGGRGRLPSEGGSCSSNGRGNDDDCAPGARSAVPVAHAVCASGEDPDLPPALQGLMRMGGFRADIRNLLRASGKFMLIRKFKQAEKVATSVKMKEQNWKKC